MTNQEIEKEVSELISSFQQNHRMCDGKFIVMDKDNLIKSLIYIHDSAMEEAMKTCVNEASSFECYKRIRALKLKKEEEK